MFTEASRYFNAPTAEAKDAKGRAVTAVLLRRLPFPGGLLTPLKGNDRLDVMAQRRYQDGTKFWHIADANTELEAKNLVEPPPRANPLVAEETLVILVPEP